MSIMQLFKLPNKIIPTIVFIILALSVGKNANAANFSLDPDSDGVPLNTPFTVNLNIDTQDEETSAVDVVIDFDPNKIEVSALDFSDPKLFPINTKIIDNTNGKLRLTSTQESPVGSFSGIDTLAVLTLKGEAIGDASLVFNCGAGKTNDTNIFKHNTSSDIAECGTMGNGTYTISVDGGIVTTVVPTVRPTLPQSGNLGPTGALVIGGGLLLGIGALLIFIL